MLNKLTITVITVLMATGCSRRSHYEFSHNTESTGASASGRHTTNEMVFSYASQDRHAALRSDRVTLVFHRPSEAQQRAFRLANGKQVVQVSGEGSSTATVNCVRNGARLKFVSKYAHGTNTLHFGNDSVRFVEAGTRLLVGDQSFDLKDGSKVVHISATGQASAITSPPPAQADMAARAAKFIQAHETQIRPLEIAVSLAWWNANVSGKDADFKIKEEAQNKFDAALADKSRFAELKEIRNSSLPGPILTRQIAVLFLAYQEKQLDPELLKRMTAKANAVEQAFNVYRAKVDGKEMTDSEVRKVLSEAKDSAARKAVWEASKGVGAIVEKDLRELVDLRNQAARTLGYKDFHVMQLALNEQSQEQVLALFDQLDELTREPFRLAKDELDQRLARHGGITVRELRPWHYHDPFFQESPAVYDSDLDAVYSKLDILKLCQDYYAGIGLPIDDVLARSDLYEKADKSPHAFCTDIDREGDVRVLANIVPNEYWMNTMLHELGHAVYSSKNIPRSVPYVLRTDAHILATEGVAMLFERPSKSADWLEAMGVRVADPGSFNATGAKMQRNQLLIFSRWCQVMLRFEKELYARPEQDLNKLWWSLVEKYQLLTRPEARNAPDYASKIHIVAAPAYYHNYMMGQLFASQVHHTIAREVLNTSPDKALYVGNKQVGAFMKKRVFAPGRTMPWDALTKFATGKPLSSEAFAADFKAK